VLLAGHSRMDNGRGIAGLTAEFVAVRDGREIYREELSVTERWERELIGGSLEGAAHFRSQFQRLAIALVHDPEFRAAVGWP